MIRYLSAVALSCCLSACSLSPQITDHAIDYNHAVEKISNEAAFLNILRSKERMPNHFTSISDISGNLSVTTGAAITSSIGGSANIVTNSVSTASDLSQSGSAISTHNRGATNYTPNINASITSRPTFTVAILDTQEFTQGIMRPLSPDILSLYIGQGWRPSMLAHLFFEGIDVTLPDGTVVDFSNTTDYVDDKCGKLTYDEIARNLKLYVSTGINNGPETIVTKVDKTPTSDEIVRLYSAGFVYKDKSVRTKPTTYTKFEFVIDKFDDSILNVCESDSSGIQVFNKNNDANNNIELKESTDKTHSVETIKRAVAVLKCGKTLSVNATGETGDEKGSIQKSTLKSRSPAGNGGSQGNIQPGSEESCASLGTSRISVPMRTTEGVIYYIGEYLRHKEECAEGNNPITKCKVYAKSNNTGDLFVISERKSSLLNNPFNHNSYITAELNGTEYSIPIPGKGEDHHRSMEVLALVLQLINLNKKAADLPHTNYLNIR